MKEIFENHGLTQFNVENVVCFKERIFLTLEHKNKDVLCNYLVREHPSRLTFVSGGKVYEVKSNFVIGRDEKPMLVYVLYSKSEILDVLGSHELRNEGKYANSNLRLTIDEIIEEV